MYPKTGVRFVVAAVNDKRAGGGVDREALGEAAARGEERGVEELAEQKSAVAIRV